MTQTRAQTEAQGGVGYAALWVADVERAADFFAAVLGWSYSVSEPSHRMIAGAGLHHGIVSLEVLPRGLWDDWPRHNTLFLSHGVDDVDSAVARIRAAGGHAGEPTDEAYGRAAECTDDQGMPFAVHADDGANAPAAPTAAPGRLAYLTLQVADTAKAKAFFSAVFGWTFAPGSVADGWQIGGIEPMGGLHGRHDRPTVVPMYTVADITAAIARVRQEGGTATEPEYKPFGMLATCADDQGTQFHLGQLGPDPESGA